MEFLNDVNVTMFEEGDAGIITHLQTYMENGEYLRYLNTIAPKDTYVG